MGMGYCKECGQSGVEVRRVHSGALICLSCMRTEKRQWVAEHFPDCADNAGGKAVIDQAISRMGMSHDEIDCSKLVVECFPGVDLPRRAEDQEQYASENMTLVADRAAVRKGDLIFFKRDDDEGATNHVGMAIGLDKDGNVVFIHSSDSHGVSIADTGDIGGYGHSTWGQLVKSIYRPK